MESGLPVWDEMVQKVRTIVADMDQLYKNAKEEQEKVELGKGLMKAYKVLSQWERPSFN